MKKVLFASTALVAATLVTTGTASAAEKIKLQLGGFSQWWVVGAWNEGDYQSANGLSYNNVDVKGNNEIYFDGSTTLDNGLKVGVHVELEAGGHTDQTTDVIDLSYAFVEGGFGKLAIGSQFGTAWTLHVSAPEAAGNAGPEGTLTMGNSVIRPTTVTPVGFSGSPTAGNTGFAGGSFTGIYSDEKNEKLTYVTPSFGGLTVGATYVPSIKAADQDNRAQPTDGIDAYALGAMYANTFGGVGVKVSANALTYDGGTAYDRSYEWALGGQVSMAGFTLGGSYKQVNDNRVNWTNTASNNSNVTVATSGAGNIWDAGVMYATGPYALSLYYIKGESQGTVNSAVATSSGKDETEITQASVKYTMGPGVDVLGTVGYAKYTDGDTVGVKANSNEGWVVATGLSLAF